MQFILTSTGYALEYSLSVIFSMLVCYKLVFLSQISSQQFSIISKLPILPLALSRCVVCGACGAVDFSANEKQFIWSKKQFILSGSFFRAEAVFFGHFFRKAVFFEHHSLNFGKNRSIDELRIVKYLKSKILLRYKIFIGLNSVVRLSI